MKIKNISTYEKLKYEFKSPAILNRWLLSLAASLTAPCCRWEVCGAAQRRAPDQERVSRGRLQDVQVPHQAQTHRGDQALRHRRQAGHHR